MFIQPAAGDAGGAIGAAYYVWNQILNHPRSFIMEKPYLGPEFSEKEISEQLSLNSEQLKKIHFVSNTNKSATSLFSRKQCLGIPIHIKMSCM